MTSVHIDVRHQVLQHLSWILERSASALVSLRVAVPERRAGESLHDVVPQESGYLGGVGDGQTRVDQPQLA